MRLIHTETLEFKEFYAGIPKYAILSHTWGDDELTLQEWLSRKAPEDVLGSSQAAGLTKILKACEQARKRSLSWIWVDTVCIDKTSSAELSEAINSMFAWYRDSAVCLVYLADVNPRYTLPGPGEVLPRHGLHEGMPHHESFRKSRWFTRGWTLQELLAPREVLFFSRNWTELGDLNECYSLDKVCVARKLSWAANRVTTRVEDIAYCLLGLLDVNMPLLYGEGAKAFVRLQEELLRSSNDYSLFTWTAMPEIRADDIDVNGLRALKMEAVRDGVGFPELRLRFLREQKLHHSIEYGMLAPDPIAFYNSGRYIWGYQPAFYPMTLTNVTLSARLPCFRGMSDSHVLAGLWCCDTNYPHGQVCIMLIRSGDVFIRPQYPRGPILLSMMAQPDWTKKLEKLSILRSPPNRHGGQVSRERRYQKPILPDWKDIVTFKRPTFKRCSLHVIWPEQAAYKLEHIMPVGDLTAQWVYRGKVGLLEFDVKDGEKAQPSRASGILKFSYDGDVDDEANGEGSPAHFYLFVGAGFDDDGKLCWYMDFIPNQHTQTIEQWRMDCLGAQLGSTVEQWRMGSHNKRPSLEIPGYRGMAVMETIRATPDRFIGTDECNAVIGRNIMLGKQLHGAVLEVYIRPDRILSARKEIVERYMQARRPGRLVRIGSTLGLVV